MANARLPEPAMPFLALLYSDREAADNAIEQVERFLGPLDEATESAHFTHSTYYRAEMGEPLFKRYVVFQDLADRDRIVSIKHQCASIEQHLARPGAGRSCRLVNLDPGYITPANLLLATFKDFSHRIYLGDSVFAEITLLAARNEWVVLPWTYPDYREPSIMAFLWAARLRLLARRRDGGGRR
ncbi:DUF4416 family protein [bacterium]|nr:DUF4416 family protein [candidate division CSSED10-310 bacterium]